MSQKTPVLLASLDDSKKQPLTLSSVTERAYFPRSEFHSRFFSHYEMLEEKQWNTYHRSAFKKLKDITTKNGHPKRGNFFNPFAFESYYRFVTSAPPLNHPTILAGSWYNEILEYQKKSADFVVGTFKANYPSSQVNINCNYRFTCVLIKIPKPIGVKNDKDWTNFVSLYFIAITNALTFKKGINIELHRRASFGFLRPAIAECHQSLRINLGLCPEEYLSCIVEAIALTERVFQNTSFFKNSPLNNPSLIQHLTHYNNNKPCQIPTNSTNIWDMLWQAADSKRQSFVYQIFRKEKVVEYLIDELFSRCCLADLNAIFSNQVLFENTMIHPLRTVLNCYETRYQGTKIVLSINDASMMVQKATWFYHIDITDNHFWDFFNRFATTLGGQKPDIDRLIASNSFISGYNYLESLLQNFYFNPAVTLSKPVVDGYGSDSDGEDTLDFYESHKSIYSRKFITATGMKAIQLAYAVARMHLARQTYMTHCCDKASTSHMYYETTEALNKYPISIPTNMNSINSGIVFFDNNHCNITQAHEISLLTKITPTDYVCCIDVTSSTTGEMNTILRNVFYNKPNIQVIIFISSGLKNEQSFSDYNPYGCLRLFTANKQTLNTMYQDLVQLEEAENYYHPRTSHLLRLQAKQHGMTPTRQAIFKPPLPNDLSDGLCDSFTTLQI